MKKIKGMSIGFDLGENICNFIKDTFDTLLYRHIDIKHSTKKTNSNYTENKIFWNDALNEKFYESKKILLKGFHITEWIPSAPGRYFTSDAINSRVKADDYKNGDEYYLSGKELMILGGIGSYRLKSRIVHSKEIFFLGASSNGISHQGIPLALELKEYHKVIEIIKDCGGCYVNIIGTLKIIPNSLSIIKYHRDVPKYCLFVDDIEIITPSSKKDLLTTIAVTFPYKESFGRDAWVFSSFKGSSKNGLKPAVNWIKTYIHKYCKNDVPILSDFDEHCLHFDNIEFAISKLNEFNLSSLKHYSKKYGFIINNGQINIAKDNATLNSSQHKYT